MSGSIARKDGFVHPCHGQAASVNHDQKDALGQEIMKPRSAGEHNSLGPSSTAFSTRSISQVGLGRGISR